MDSWVNNQREDKSSGKLPAARQKERERERDGGREAKHSSIKRRDGIFAGILIRNPEV